MRLSKRPIKTKFPSSTLEVDTLMKISDWFLSRYFNRTSDKFFCFIRSFFYFKLNHNQVLQGFALQC